ncbi:MAG TPA: alpha/beta hydrolase [Candidatus Binatia bacterium]|nr:alpha/beta hydrolase [Candidatus Binatia bacterium]
MPHVDIPSGRIWYDEAGAGAPLVCLHSGWGRAAMPFDDAASVLESSHRLIFPDRHGYGRSTPLDELPVGYHRDAAVDLADFLDALAIDRAILWGHSDGAITAALFAADHPERTSALVLEAIHFHRAKSREFFERFVDDPDSLPAYVIERLRADHGDRWRTVIRMHSRVWLEFHAIGGDFYEGKLESIRCPVMLLDGAGDPHTAPSEVEELARHLPHATLQPVSQGGHSPHSEPATARFCSERVLEFLRAHRL